MVDVAFALPQAGTDYHMVFNPDQVSQATFIAQIQTLHSQGRKVLISIGGATAPISLDTPFERNTFVSTMNDILNTYGFDGIDIDLEGSSVTVSGGTIANPVDAKIIHLIEAFRQIMQDYQTAHGKKMVLTMAPETAFVQGGMAAYGSIWGAYLPVIHALRDSLNLLHVQLYNSGSMFGLDGNIYAQGTADFIVAMTEAVIQGFTTQGGFFQGLPPQKVAIGLPACPSAAGGGYVTPSVLKQAADYLRGQGARPGSYQLVQFGGYPDLGGLMTWSVNWDAVSSCATTWEFAHSYARIFTDSVNASLRFTAASGNAQPDEDRVVIALDAPHRPVDVGGDMTIEWWMKAEPGHNLAAACTPAQWRSGNVLIDRDVFGDGDHGEYGVSLCNRRLTVGFQRGNLAVTGVTGSSVIDDGAWHHIAVTRVAASGSIVLYVDGVAEASVASGASSLDVSYRDGRSTSYADDPWLVLGAEKHDEAGTLSFKGGMDEVRISAGIRYSANFTRPCFPPSIDNQAVAYYHFNEGAGTLVHDQSGAAGGPSNGTVLQGTAPIGPFWSYDTPFYSVREITTALDAGPGSLRQVLTDAPAGSTLVFAPHLAGQTIQLQTKLNINKEMTLRDLNSDPTVITIGGQGPVFEVLAAGKVVLWDLHVRAGTGTSARAISNIGQLVLRSASIEDDAIGAGSSILNSGTMRVQGLSRLHME
jgi:chitinase